MRYWSKGSKDDKEAMKIRDAFGVLGYNTSCVWGNFTNEFLYHTLENDNRIYVVKKGTIEYVPGGLLTHNTIRNDYDWLAPEACSAPFIYDVVDWFEKEHGLIINASPLFGVNFDEDDEMKNGLMGWHAMVYHINGQKPSYIMEVRENRYMSIADGIKEALDLVEEKKNGTCK